MMTNRVRLTPAAATRFPDLAGRAGSIVLRDRLGGDAAWVLVSWSREHESEPPETWLPPGDVEAIEDDGSQPLDPSDPNAPAP